MSNRRNFLKQAGSITAGSVITGASGISAIGLSCSRNKKGVILIDPKPLFEISPLLYMQFMEPLGATEPSVEGSWNYNKQDWREDFIDCVKDLAPDMIRWGGIVNRYYKWREGIGPVEKRPWMYNYHWGGKETNRVGTHEIMDFCERIGAKPILGVNFESDGETYFKNTVHGENRIGSVEEAADWVSYCNDPVHREREANGRAQPLNVTHWQLGNESSYIDTFNQEQYIDTMLRFASTMKERDPSLSLLAWGDAPSCVKLSPDEPLEGNLPWAGPVAQAGAGYLDYVCFHMMGVYSKWENSVLKAYDYLNDPAQAWAELIEMGSIAEYRIGVFRKEMEKVGSKTKLAVTEGHLSLSPYNINTILLSWLSTAYHARCLNTYLRNGDVVKISTASDFNGSRWTVNSVMMPQPGGASFLTPVGHLMKWFNKKKGKHGIRLTSQPEELDIAASLDGDNIFLHVLNKSFTHSISAEIQVADYQITGGTVMEMAPENRMQHVDQANPHVFDPIEKPWKENHSFPHASVSIVKLKISKNA